jgi:hypothetical protein
MTIPLPEFHLLTPDYNGPLLRNTWFARVTILRINRTIKDQYHSPTITGDKLTGTGASGIGL